MVTGKLISAFVLATRIVQSLFFLIAKLQASSHLLWLYSPVCVGPGRKPRRPVFSQRGSYNIQAHSLSYECFHCSQTNSFLYFYLQRFQNVPNLIAKSKTGFLMRSPISSLEPGHTDHTDMVLSIPVTLTNLICSTK